ncbi:MAG: RnfABCDGE type electron transport complex subunit B [Nevskiaceae bacterium]|nr:MAG: RnfABCDGE type electron transport complex subunit B [Nevskiaceae bacterium]TBR73198.1 MAG: RnfABCDGE type electron transport complex subunit B [Nevskiaceae bacterium]
MTDPLISNHESPISRDLVGRIDAVLPQTQCTRCGFADCRAYAEAMAHGEAEINRCPPGGAAGIQTLAELLGRPVLPLDPDCGSEETAPMVAFVREDECIGCYKCARACPVDAFVGARQRLHTVIESECTGCELCIPACPVDCIELRPRQVDGDFARQRADHSRRRYAAHQAHMAERASEREAMGATHIAHAAREARITSFLGAARGRIGRPGGPRR